MGTEFTATYSAEDNKLRLYADERLEKELYDRVHKAGFKYAPVQKLFVAPKWTPYREDLCIELAGEITAEESTMIERAEAKADRLDTLAAKRTQQAGAYHQAADKISERFAYGQPILVGHHSEGRARRDQKKMQNAMDAAIKAQSSVTYWRYRAEGVERHANRKVDPGVRARRIKTLLAELKDRQRDINHAFVCLELWTKLKHETDQEVRNKLTDHYAGARIATGSVAPCYAECSLWSDLRDNKITVNEVIDKCIEHHSFHASSPYTLRWISHILNRLVYERSELGEVQRFTGVITAPMLQVFARTHGADKPKATQSDNGFLLVTRAPLPLHITQGIALELSVDEWCDLMQSVGYEVPAPRAAKAVILNFKAGYIKGHSWGNVQTFRQITLTKTEYSAIYNDYRGVKFSECKQFRFKVCKNPEQKGWDAEWCAVYLSDSKLHETPVSDSVLAVEAALVKNG